MSFEVAECRDFVTTYFSTEAKETKTSVPFHSDGSFSSGVKSTSAFLEPCGTRKSNEPREPQRLHTSLSAYWVV